MKKSILMKKMMSVIMVMCMLVPIAAQPVASLVTDVISAIESRQAANSVTLSAKDGYTSIDDIKLPEVKENPYDVKVDVKAYPIYSSRILYSLYKEGLVAGYGTWKTEKEGRSPYYTAALNPWYYWRADETTVVENGLPYREMFNDSMSSHQFPVFNSVSTVTDGALFIDNRYLHSSSNYGWQTLESRPDIDFLNNPVIDKSQAYLRVGATLHSGYGRIMKRTSDDGETGEQAAIKRALDGPVEMMLNCKLSEFDKWEEPYFMVDGGSMSNMYYVLIDDTAPTAQHIEVIEDEENQELILKITFNEGIRWNSDFAKYYLDEVYLDVELRDLRTNQKSTLRAYISELGGGEKQNQLTFRGKLGDYIYKDFRAERIVQANFRNHVYSSIEYAVIDMVDAMYTDAYTGAYYGNKIHMCEDVWISSAILTDYAGNTVNTASITNWKLNSTFINNSFEAIDVKVYNDITAGKIGEDPGPATDWPEDIDRTHLFAGPNNELTVHVFVDTKLTEEEARKVSAQFNIKNADGTPLVVPCSSSYTFVPAAEVYGEYSKEEITCLIFDGIQLEQDMTMDLQEGEIPQIKVASLTDTIEDKDAWYQVVNPTRVMYGDFDAPTIAVNKKSVDTTKDENGNYVVVAELAVDEIVDAAPYIAGIQGSTADIFLGGGVLYATDIKYAITRTVDTPKPEEYTDATVPMNGTTFLKTVPLVGNSQKYYIHLLIPSGGLLIDDLNVMVRATDLVGNATVTHPAIALPYQVDEISPEIEFIGEDFAAEFNLNLNIVDIEAAVTLNIVDYNQVASVAYCWLAPNETPNEETAWMTQQITSAKDVITAIKKQYENVSEDVLETLWVRATDTKGNESEPVCRQVLISTAKPATNTVISSDLNKPSSHPQITVIGPQKSITDAVGYTRVTVAPTDSFYTWEYVTVVETGKELDLFSFVGQQWYKVSRNGKWYDTVAPIEIIDEGFVLTEEHLFYDLFTYYGELKVSFENGYGDMTPVTGEYVYAAANAGSYMEDPNYYTVQYSSRSTESTPVHKVDFGQIEDGEGVIRIENADQGSNAIRYNAIARGTSPLQNTKIHFSLSNMLKLDWGMMDVDFDNSYMELHYEDKTGTDTVVVKEIGLSGADTQFFSIPALTDDGELFGTGMYYLVVAIKSHSGRTDTYRTSNIVLDADAVENDGLWQYSYQTNYNINGAYSFDNDKVATDAPFTSMGLSVSVPGEVMRSNVFAVYSAGVSGYHLLLQTDQSAKTFDGITVGKVEGFRIWNMASNPTDEEIAAVPFARNDLDPEDPSKTAAHYSITQGVDSIYSADTIPKGAAGFEDFYLMKGVNTICYQVKMENGYISPVRQFTVIVSDYTPTLNMAIENYTPSHNASKNEAITNVHDLTLFVESAYSLNGTGNVAIEIWGRYNMAVNGTMAIDPNHDITINHLEKLEWENGEVVNLKVDDTVVLTENSYTGEFPVDIASVCTAVFVAIDEYGGITVVAPQIGDHIRVGNSAGKLVEFEAAGMTLEVVESNFNIEWDGGYHDDPYVVGNNSIELRTFYNQPKYFGNDFLGFENIFNYENGEDVVVMTSLPDIQYNCFNIDTNKVTFGPGKQTYGRFDATSGVRYENGKNFDLINWDCAKITFWGGDLSEEITLDLAGGGANAAGYIGGAYADGVFSFSVANPQSTSIADIGKEYTRSYKITGYNIYGDPFEQGGSITVKCTGQLSASFHEYSETVDLSNVKWADATITFTGEDLASAVTVAFVGGEDNDAGYLGGEYKDHVLSFKLFCPATEQYPIGYKVTRDFTIQGTYENGSAYTKTGEVEVMYADPNRLVYGDTLEDYQYSDKGALIYLNICTLEHDSVIKTGIFDGSVYTATLTDYYGNLVWITYDISDESTVDAGTQVEYSTMDQTAFPVTVIIHREDAPIYVEIADYAVMGVQNNNSNTVTVTVSKNLVFAYRYTKADGTQQVVRVRVDQIVEAEPKVVWSFGEDDIRTDAHGTKYVYGPVKAYLVDPNFTLTDHTGKTPSFTFYPDGETSYTFKGVDVIARLGNERVSIDGDFVAALIYEDVYGSQTPIEVRAKPDPLGFYDENGNLIEDTESPNVQVLAYANQGGYYADVKYALQLESARNSNAMTDYPGYTLFEYSGTRADASKMLEALGWSSAYRFEVEVSDRSRVKLFIKEGLYAEAPDFEEGYSDAIEGVRLNSRLIDVTKSAKFTLFVVDRNNNSVSIPFNVTEVGAHPIPTVTKVPLTNQLVRIYVDAPVTDPASDVAEFAIQVLDLGIEAKQDEAGRWYVEYKANDDYLINYTYKYKGERVTGTVDASIVEISDRKIGLAKNGIEWSENKAFESTDRDVTVQITLTDLIGEVIPVGEVNAEVLTYEISGQMIKVRYTDNHAAIKLRCIAVNGTEIVVDLDDVANIDRTAPVITLKEKMLSADGKSVRITLTSNERAIFVEGGYIGELKDGFYYYYRTVTENGIYTYHFTDMGGTLAQFDVDVTEIVTSTLSTQYSTSVNGENSVSDPADLELSIGDYVYVKPSRNVTAQFNGGEEIALDATKWTAFEITEEIGGLLPYIVLWDEYGNTLTHQFSKVAIPDGTAPTIVIVKDVYSVQVGTDRAEIEAALLQNFQAFDDDANLTYSVIFTEDVSVSGVTTVEYRATDTTGNVGKLTGKLRITSGAEPWVTVDGVQIERDGSAIVKAGETVTLTVDVQGRSYCVFMKTGIKTVAQMKIGSTDLSDYTTSTDPISIEGLEQGYYTVCVLTQDRDYFRIILYVE